MGASAYRDKMMGVQGGRKTQQNSCRELAQASWHTAPVLADLAEAAEELQKTPEGHHDIAKAKKVIYEFAKE
jgi:hypothetical protein